MDFSELKTEYLIIVETEDSFCSDKESFNNVLRGNTNIVINDNELKYKNLVIEYMVQVDSISNTTEKYFHIKLTCREENNIWLYEELLRTIRSILMKISKRKIEILWDDVSFYYANQCYPLIYEIENLMRKLITKFMLTNLGVGWTKVNVPNTVKDSIKKKGKEKLEVLPNYLYETDFIQLSNFLFDEYQTDSTTNLLGKINSIKNISEITLSELKKFLPKSNWERYFSEVVDCDHKYLKRKWESLYNLRCKIAHNNRINREDFTRIKNLVNEIKEKLELAIYNLDKITISDEDKENIAEHIVYSTSELYGKYIAEYKRFEEILTYYLVEKGYRKHLKASWNSWKLIDKLVIDGMIDEMICDELKNTRIIRNRIVHENNINISERQIISCIKLIKKVSHSLESNTKIKFDDLDT